MKTTSIRTAPAALQGVPATLLAGARCLLTALAVIVSPVSCGDFFNPQDSPGTSEEEDLSQALSVSEVRALVLGASGVAQPGGQDGGTGALPAGVWVRGYIVGGDLKSGGKASFEPPFKAATNLVMGPSADSQDCSECISVQLPQGELRNALNLAAHPENIGREVYIKGDIAAAYFALPGVKNIKAYKWPWEAL